MPELVSINFKDTKKKRDDLIAIAKADGRSLANYLRIATDKIIAEELAK